MTALAALLEPFPEKQLRETPRVAVRVGLYVGREKDRRDRHDSGRVAREHLFPRFPFSRREIEPHDLCGELPVSEDEKRSPALRPAADLIVFGETGNRAG